MWYGAERYTLALAILHLCEWLYRASKPNNNNNNTHFLQDTVYIDSYLKTLENCCIVGVKAKTLISESRQSTATMIGAMPEGTDVISLLHFYLYFQIYFLQSIINVSYWF